MIQYSCNTIKQRQNITIYDDTRNNFRAFFKVYGLDDDFRLCGLEFHYEIAVNENYSVL